MIFQEVKASGVGYTLVSQAQITPLPKVSLCRRLAILPIRVYQCTLSYFLGGHCRFTPSCSKYAVEAIERHGVFKGWGLALYRLGRCHPLCKGGFDPVPPESSAEQH